MIGRIVAGIKKLAQWVWKVLRSPRFWIGVGILAILIWIGGSIYLRLNAAKHVFKPEHSKNEEIPAEWQTIWLRNKSGNDIQCLFVTRSKTPEVVLYLHGNWGRDLYKVSELNKRYNVLSCAYPGYSLSTGTPTTENVYETADLAIAYLTGHSFPQEQIIVWGHSLGGSPAVYTGTRYSHLKKVIIVNTFASIQGMCWPEYYIFCAFGGDVFNTASLAEKVVVPIVQYQAPDDKHIPMAEGMRLFNRFPGHLQRKFITHEGEHSEFNVLETLDN